MNSNKNKNIYHERCNRVFKSFQKYITKDVIRGCYKMHEIEFSKVCLRWQKRGSQRGFHIYIYISLLNSYINKTLICTFISLILDIFINFTRNKRPKSQKVWGFSIFLPNKAKTYKDTIIYQEISWPSYSPN